MTNDFTAVPCPTEPVILYDLEREVAHIGWRVPNTGRIYPRDSCGDQLKYFPHDIREAGNFKHWCGTCAEGMITA